VPDPSIPDYINISQYAYGIDQAIATGSLYSPLPPQLSGYQVLTNAAGQPIVSSVSQLGDGFAAIALINPTTGNVVIAFEGSVFDTSTYGEGTVVADALIVQGKIPDAFTDAVKFAEIVAAVADADGIQASHIFLTGGSLGGGEAEYIAAMAATNSELAGFGGGKTFGAPGVPDFNKSLSQNQSLPPLINYGNWGDPVFNYASDTPLGTQLNAGGPNVTADHVGTIQWLGNQLNEIALLSGTLNAAAYFNLLSFGGINVGDALLMGVGATLNGTVFPLLSSLPNHSMSTYANNILSTQTAQTNFPGLNVSQANLNQIVSTDQADVTAAAAQTASPSYYGTIFPSGGTGNAYNGSGLGNTDGNPFETPGDTGTLYNYPVPDEYAQQPAKLIDIQQHISDLTLNGQSATALTYLSGTLTGPGIAAQQIAQTAVAEINAAQPLFITFSQAAAQIPNAAYFDSDLVPQPVKIAIDVVAPQNHTHLPASPLQSVNSLPSLPLFAFNPYTSQNYISYIQVFGDVPFPTVDGHHFGPDGEWNWYATYTSPQGFSVFAAQSYVSAALQATQAAATDIENAASAQTDAESSAIAANVQDAAIGSSTDVLAASTAAKSEAAWGQALQDVAWAETMFQTAATQASAAQQLLDWLNAYPTSGNGITEHYLTYSDAITAEVAFNIQQKTAEAFSDGETAFENLLSAIAVAWNVSEVTFALDGANLTAAGGDLVVAAPAFASPNNPPASQPTALGPGQETLADGPTPSIYAILPDTNITISSFHAGPNGSVLDFLGDAAITGTVTQVGGNTEISVARTTVTQVGGNTNTSIAQARLLCSACRFRLCLCATTLRASPRSFWMAATRM
jgi:hypothetical protein